MVDPTKRSDIPPREHQSHKVKNNEASLKPDLQALLKERLSEPLTAEIFSPEEVEERKRQVENPQSRVSDLFKKTKGGGS